MVKISKIKLNTLIIFLLGMFATMPIVCIKVSGRFFSLFTVFFVLTIIYFIAKILFSEVKFKIGKNSFYIIAWLIMALVSSLFGWLYFQNNSLWKNASISYVSKLLIFILFAVIWCNQRCLKENTRNILNGLLVGCILNLIWTVIDGIGFYIFGISINNIVFRSYALSQNIRYGTISLIVNGLIRASGFNYDPAHIGFIAPAMIAYAIYKKKGWLFVLSVFAIFCSASTTALVCSLIIVIFNFKRIKLNGLFKKSNKSVVAKLLVIILILILIIISFDFIGGIVEKFISRIFNTYGKLNSNDPRLIYWTQFFNAVFFAGFRCITGTGFGTASYAYVFDNNILSRLGSANFFPYDMEMTYFSYFFDLGVFGLTVYIIMLYKLYKGFLKRNSENSIIISALLCGMIVSSFFYHYTLMAMQVIILIVGMGLLDINKKVSIQNVLVVKKV